MRADSSPRFTTGESGIAPARIPASLRLQRTLAGSPTRDPLHTPLGQAHTPARSSAHTIMQPSAPSSQAMYAAQGRAAFQNAMGAPPPYSYNQAPQFAPQFAPQQYAQQQYPQQMQPMQPMMQPMMMMQQPMYQPAPQQIVYAQAPPPQVVYAQQPAPVYIQQQQPATQVRPCRAGSLCGASLRAS